MQRMVIQRILIGLVTLWVVSHEAFERTHFGYIHKWLRERGLIRYDYMDEASGGH